jgi:hypothetical protein
VGTVSRCRGSPNVFDFLAELHDQLIERAGGAVVIDALDFVQGRLARDRIAAFRNSTASIFISSGVSSIASLPRFPRRALQSTRTLPNAPPAAALHAREIELATGPHATINQ